MARRIDPHYTTELDIYIYDYLMKRNLITTAKSFMEEAQARAFVNDLKVIDIPGGLLSEWWSIFWEHFVSITDALAYTDGLALDQKQLEMGHQYIQEEEQMEQNDAGLDNSRLSKNVILNHKMIHSKLSQLPGISRMNLPDSAVYPGFLGQGQVDMNVSEHMQQPYQQSISNMLVVPSSGQDVAKNNFTSLGSVMPITEGFNGMDKGISGLSSQAQKLEDHPQPCQLNKQQIVFSDTLVGEISVDGSNRTNSPQDDEGAADVLDLSGDVSAQKTTGIVFEEVLNLKASSKKIFCCDFSSDGKLLASAGDENKVFIWNISNNLEKNTWEAHSSFITDISFRPNDTMLATASSDKTVRLWDASQSDNGFQTFVGHSSRVRSVDFHPTDPCLLCSSDDGGKIFFWTIGQPNPRISQVTGRRKVRFHPLGDCLASSIGNTANIIQVEKDTKVRCLQGSSNNKFIQSLCWSERGNWLATVSEDCVRVWSSLGECVRELSGNLSFFRSCSFHPIYPNTLVIGGYQTITLWNFAENKRVLVQPHSCYVSDLAASCATGLIASSSHDGSLKISR